jgi:hypothetical protein
MIITSQNQLQLSPIISELCHYELTKKRFIFSVLMNPRHQLVEFVVSRRSGICYKLTHDSGQRGWSRNPHIERVEELEE